jgi:ABC-2 type transport system permease protein
MATDSISRRVALKEIRLFFSSPVAWLFLASFAAISLFTFFWVESFFARNTADVRPLFEWMPTLLIFLCAALTMRMWSEERRSGTLEHVLTQPASLWRFVLGKFLACFTLLLLAMISTLPLPITVALLANLDWGPVFAGYLATSLLGGAYLAIGLFVSARTDNPIVSLIGAVILCGLLYMLGSPTLTNFFDDSTGDALRLLGSGARFDSITRGIIDLRDLFYYLSLILTFLALNVFVLEKERWASSATTPRHRHWRAGIALLLCNLLLANIWLGSLGSLRLDMTQGRQFSISQATLDLLDELQEPLLIRGYFSSKTHPSLAPLGPQLRDLLEEFEVAGDGRVRVEIVDPADHPDIEQEANKRYDIAATPFQVADRHQSALVNAYFNVLVSYGNQHVALGFGDLIEVKTSPNSAAQVMLRNPEYDITRAIKKVLFEYRMGGNLFDSIDEPVEFIGYVSGDALLPEPLREYKEAITAQLDRAAQSSQGKFSVRFIAPEARGGAIAQQITQQWGFKPMVAAPGDERQFYFYLTLADSKQVVQLPMENFDPADFKLTLDSGLKRFAHGFTKTVALSLPAVDTQMSQYHLGGPTFTHLEQAITQDYSIELEDLSDGNVSPEAEILAVVAPLQLDETSVFAIDQFLMRGGTVILATSPFTTEISDGQMQLQDWNSGLQPWLAYHGLTIGNTLVLDEQNAVFPAPVIRRSGDHEFRDVLMVNYPYFVDLRTPGLAPSHPVTAGLPHLTMAWPSAITAEPDSGRQITPLLRSSVRSWLSDSVDITPNVDASGLSNLLPPETAPDPADPHARLEPRILGIVVEGRFDSFFANGRPPLSADTGYNDSAPRYRGPQNSSVLQRSGESARIVLYASNDFMDDQILSSLVMATGNQYLGPIELFMNTLDWALQDDQLLEIRSRAHFNRTLPPMERRAQELIEYINYGLALLWLCLLALGNAVLTRLRRRQYAKGLAL